MTDNKSKDQEEKILIEQNEFRVRDMNFELREMNFGLREIKLSCEVLDSQSHRRIARFLSL